MTNPYKIPLEDFIEAYMECRKNKRSTANSIKFEVDWESKLMDLYHQVNQGLYKISRSICFIVRKGVKAPREVFAADFRDRIVHHLLFKKLNPYIEEYMVKRRYSSRKGFGTLDSSNQVYQGILELTNNFQDQDCWVSKFDIKSFFMSIDRKLLWKELRQFIKKVYTNPDISLILHLVKMVVLNDPTLECIKKSPDHLWKLVPDHKSLFKIPKGKGLAIGNLTSQLFANFFLTSIDKFIEKHFPHHTGFVDDHAIVTKHKDKLLHFFDKLRSKLAKKKLELNPNKYYIQHYSKGIKFTGCQIKMGRKYSTSRVVTNFLRCVYGNNKAIDKVNDIFLKTKLAPHFVSSLNSYTGIMGHFNSYSIRRKILTMISKPWFKYLYIGGHHQKVALKKRYLLPYRYVRKQQFKLYYGY